MTIAEILALIIGIVAVLTFIGTFIARVTKLETRADVSDEKHSQNAENHKKQDVINLRIEEHHIEVMTAIATISTKLDMKK